jgi:hypothetical protein
MLTGAMFCASLVALQTPVAKAATVEEMQAQITTLMAQITALRGQIHDAQGNTGSTTDDMPHRPPMGGSNGSTSLQIGTQIVTTEALRIRSAAGIHESFIATQPAGVSGVIVEGPVEKDGYRWFKVDYATGADGWNVGSWLKSNTAPVSGDWAHPPKLGLDGNRGSSTPDGRPKTGQPIENWIKEHGSTTKPLPPRPVHVPMEGGNTVPPAGTGSSSVSGAVLGASTDVLSEISVTLNTISETLNHLE